MLACKPSRCLWAELKYWYEYVDLLFRLTVTGPHLPPHPTLFSPTLCLSVSPVFATVVSASVFHYLRNMTDLFKPVVELLTFPDLH